ncbi:hypothetical protein V501_06917 [Pseudogymnoascus sp. VKM F-4519 (FW-2642)]|nr:hypothetical protein V501_06917 [Pseudogymnoascus sp. VKM F-4519 (FW-2642)]
MSPWLALLTSISVTGFEGSFFNPIRSRYLYHLPNRRRAAMVSKTQKKTVVLVEIKLETRHNINSTRVGKMNIWTHLIGCLGFVVTAFALYRHVINSKNLHLTIGDKLAFSSSIAAATVCFGLSATFHTFRSHSYKVHHFWGKIDVFGICVLALGAGSSMTFYAFYCRPAIQRVYWGLNLFSALAAAVVLFDTGGGGSKMRTLRGGVFTLLALSALLPFFHSAGLMGWSRARSEIGAIWYVAEGISLLLGVSLFVSRVPERLRPGSFDIWGHSHQLFHICAVTGGSFHVAALVVGYNYRQTHPNC